MKQYLLLIVIPIILFSCQKEYTPGDITGGGNGGGGGTPATGCNTYFPTTTGTTWTYNYDGSIETNTIITPDTLIQSKVFKRLNQNLSGSVISSFIREENGNVFEFVDLDNNGYASGKVLLNVLRTSAAVGEKWRDTIIINGITEKFEYTMLEKNITYQVDSLNFSNVIHIQYNVKLDYPPIFNDELIQTTDAWFAKCIGPVETETQISYFGVNSTSSVKIKSYSIK